MTRQKILITGASSGLGAGMACAFAAKGRDLALCARRTERLEELKTELGQRYPDVRVVTAALDVNDHDTAGDAAVVGQAVRVVIRRA
jgi:short-subunit dehydrogenase